LNVIHCLLLFRLAYFYPRDAELAQYVLHLRVRPSVTSRNNITRAQQMLR